jgi:hypothetical protein
MADYRIPQDLVLMVREGRVIPFLGAGFSAALGLPGWRDLLRKVAAELKDPLGFDEVTRLCQGDNLQIAEYYYLKSDRSIGPLRYIISKELKYSTPPIMSGAHIELVNLGPRQIYTTNYDDAIEAVYEALDLPATVVTLPKHVAAADKDKTQIVKYHGDLRHDQTLVLTESSYYQRLDFESPMDLKFRSDILGRSVLFIGYSFRDINIRVIWFKLMRMMKDIRPTDRPTSYIVTASPNPVLEALYEEVGIKTVVLDPEASIPNNHPGAGQKRDRLLADFLLDLASEAGNGTIPGTHRRQYLSSSLVARVNEFVRGAAASGYSFWHLVSPGSPLCLLAGRSIHPEFRAAVVNILTELNAPQFDDMATYSPQVACDIAVSMLAQHGPHPAITSWVLRGLADGRTRKTLLAKPLPWRDIFGFPIGERIANLLLERFRSELERHRQRKFDDDLAYLADLAARVSQAQIVDPSRTAVCRKAATLLQDAAGVYPAIALLAPDPNSAPAVDPVLEQIALAARRGPAGPRSSAGRPA